MRRIVFFLTVLLMTTSCHVLAAPVLHHGYELPVDVYVNETRLACTGFLDDSSSVFVPLRIVGTALHMSVTWHEERRCAEIAGPNGSLYCYVDAPEASTLWAVLKDNAFYVPLRAVAESFSCTVAWDAEKYIAYVESPYGMVPAEVASQYNAYDMQILAALVQLEAGAEPMDGKIGVAGVVMNRIQSSSFPDTVHDVIYDNKFGVQFPPAFSHDLSHMTVKTDCIFAVRLAERGMMPAGNALYFSPAARTNAWAAKHRTYVTTIGKTAFYH